MVVIKLKLEKDWHLILAKAIRQAHAGDIIECETHAMTELAKCMVNRIRPGKNLVFIVGGA